MKVELSIKDDKELRNLIKDQIKGQVVNITREFFQEIIEEEFERLLGAKIRSNLNLDRELRRVVNSDSMQNMIARQAANNCINTHGEKIIVAAEEKIAIRVDQKIASEIKAKIANIPFTVSFEQPTTS